MAEPSPGPRHKEALALAVCAGTIGFALAFAYPAYARIRVLWYYPLQHRWAFELRPSALAMDWYGRVVLALGLGALAGVLAYVVARRVKPSARALWLWAGWALAASLVAMSLYVYQLARRVPHAEPLPSWYQAK